MAYSVSKEVFRDIIREALADVPEVFADALASVRIDVRGRPSPKMLRDADVSPGESLLGLYQGRPATHRSVEDSGVLPDVILLFQHELEEACDTESELIKEVRKTVFHELGHHFGLDEGNLDQLGF